MTELERIDVLRKERGISRSFIIQRMGLKSNTYFIDVEKRGGHIPTKRLEQIADILDTSTEYLKGETNVKEKSPSKTDGLNSKAVEMWEAYSAAPAEIKEAIEKLLKI